jgi:lipopolysaccharide transport system permease protein
MARLVEAYQTILVVGRPPDWTTLWPVALEALLLCILGLRLFRRHAGEMVDEL